MNKQNILQIVSPHLRLVLILALLTGMVVSVWHVQAGKAATDIQVTTFEDKFNTDGFCSLREAVIAANRDQASSSSPGECPAGSGADTISLPTGTYTLTRSDNGKEDSSSTGDLDIKGDLTIRPIYHSDPDRIEAHIFVCFLAYCLQVTLRHRLRAKAPGLTVRQVLDKFARIQLMDVHFPTTDGRELVFARYTQPEKDQLLLLAQLKWQLPPQAPPRITAKRELENGYRLLPSQSLTAAEY